MSILGIDLGGTNVRAGVVRQNRLGRVLKSPVPAAGSVDDVMDVIYGLADRLAAEKTEGIGVGVPSVVDPKTGVVYDVQNIPSWKKVPLKALLEKRYKVPAHVNNDANCFAAGERYFGKARHCDHAVGLTIGTGLGAGIIANGRLYSGAVCGAGEFGMLPYKDRNFEFYASGQYFKNVHRASGKLLFEKARSGDADARRAFSEFGTHLGEAIKAILYALDPEIIILGGSISRAHAFFKAAMWKAVRGFAYTPTVERIRIEVSGVKNIAVLGAAALFLDAAERTGTVKPSGARLKK